MSLPSTEATFQPVRSMTSGRGSLEARTLLAASAGKARRGRLTKEMWGQLGEEFRSLRTKITSAFTERQQKTLLVTSSISKEGKSTVSSYLAKSLAQVGRKVLLIDCDLRYPDLHTLFQTERVPGVSEVLRGAIAAEEAVVPTEDQGLDLLTSGGSVPNPAELLDSPALPALLQGMATRYDLLVIDSPPIVSITDTLILARHADGILFVVKGFSTPREMVKSALDQLQDRPVLGVVLNGISTPREYGYYY